MSIGPDHQGLHWIQSALSVDGSDPKHAEDQSQRSFPQKTVHKSCCAYAKHRPPVNDHDQMSNQSVRCSTRHEHKKLGF